MRSAAKARTPQGPHGQERSPRSPRQARWWGATRRSERYAAELRNLRHRGLWATSIIEALQKGRRMFPFPVAPVDVMRAAIDALAEERARIGPKRRAAPPTCLDPEEFARFYAPLPGQLAMPGADVSEIPFSVRRAADQASRRDAIALWEQLSLSERAPFEALLKSRVALACVGLVLTAWHLIRGPYVATHAQTATTLTLMGIPCRESTIKSVQQRLARAGFYHVEWNIVRRPRAADGERQTSAVHSQLGNTLLPGRRLLHIYAAALLAFEGGQRAADFQPSGGFSPVLPPGSDCDRTHTLPHSGEKDPSPAPARSHMPLAGESQTGKVRRFGGASSTTPLPRASAAVTSSADDHEEAEDEGAAKYPSPEGRSSPSEPLGLPPPSAPPDEPRRVWPGYGVRLQRAIATIAAAPDGETARQAVHVLKLFGVLASPELAAQAPPAAAPPARRRLCPRSSLGRSPARGSSRASSSGMGEAAAIASAAMPTPVAEPAIGPGRAAAAPAAVAEREVAAPARGSSSASSSGTLARAAAPARGSGSASSSAIASAAMPTPAAEPAIGPDRAAAAPAAVAEREVAAPARGSSSASSAGTLARVAAPARGSGSASTSEASAIASTAIPGEDDAARLQQDLWRKGDSLSLKLAQLMRRFGRQD